MVLVVLLVVVLLRPPTLVMVVVVLIHIPPKLEVVAQAFSSSPTHFRYNLYITIIKSVTEMCWIL